MHLIVLVVDDPDKCDELLPAWLEAGATGATILESTGMQRVRHMGLRDDLPLMPSISKFFKRLETRHRTIFTVVWDEETVDRIVEVTEAILGPLEDEHNGFMFATKVDRAFGLRKTA